MGCNQTKQASQPKTKPGQQSPTKGSASKQFESPSKINLKKIKEIPATELAKHKPNAILGFIKSGNLPMVHGLIKHYNLDKSVILLTGF